MTGMDRQQAAVNDAIRRLEEDMQREQRRARTAVERIVEGAVKLLGGNKPPSHHPQAEGDRPK